MWQYNSLVNMRILRAIKLKTLICVRSIDMTYHYLIWALIFKCRVPMKRCTAQENWNFNKESRQKKQTLY